MRETGPGSCTASPTRSRFSVERIEAQAVPTMNANDPDKVNENTTGRFAVTQMSDTTPNTQQSAAQQAMHQQSDNFEVMSGSVSSTVSSGGNNTPHVEGTPTSTVHSQHGHQAERYDSYSSSYNINIEKVLISFDIKNIAIFE